MHPAQYIAGGLFVVVGSFFRAEVIPLVRVGQRFFRVEVLDGIAQCVETDQAVGNDDKAVSFIGKQVEPARILDYFTPMLGSKYSGGSKWGNWGCIIGTLVGLLFLPWGIILGPFLGAVIGELLGNKEFSQASFQ